MHGYKAARNQYIRLQQGSKVAREQGSKVARLQGCKVARLQGSKVARLQGSTYSMTGTIIQAMKQWFHHTMKNGLSNLWW